MPSFQVVKRSRENEPEFTGVRVEVDINSGDGDIDSAYASLIIYTLSGIKITMKLFSNPITSSATLQEWEDIAAGVEDTTIMISSNDGNKDNIFYIHILDNDNVCFDMEFNDVMEISIDMPYSHCRDALIQLVDYIKTQFVNSASSASSDI